MIYYCNNVVYNICHTKHHKYINISQIKENEESKSIYNQQVGHSDNQYDHSNLILYQENGKDAT